MYGTVVGVLRGGPSHAHEASLMSGHAVVSNLPREHYTVRDIYIDKQGVWHERGKPSTPADILRTVEVVVVALHGEYGEDGEVQKLLEKFGIPYTGSDSLASYMTMHKVLAKERATESGLKTPKYEFIEQGSDIEQAAYNIIRNFHQPVVVKPVRGSSSAGVVIVGGYAPVYHAIEQLVAEAGGVLVEECIRGTEATVGVIENFRNEQLYALPPVEIIPPQNSVCPGRFTKQITDELTQQARTMHQALGLRHYSRSDFIVTPRGIYYLETNSLPGLTRESLLPKSLSSVGVGFPEFLTHIVGLALAS